MKSIIPITLGGAAIRTGIRSLKDEMIFAVRNSLAYPLTRIAQLIPNLSTDTVATFLSRKADGDSEALLTASAGVFSNTGPEIDETFLDDNFKEVGIIVPEQLVFPAVVDANDNLTLDFAKSGVRCSITPPDGTGFGNLYDLVSITMLSESVKFTLSEAMVPDHVIEITVDLLSTDQMRADFPLRMKAKFLFKTVSRSGGLCSGGGGGGGTTPPPMHFNFNATARRSTNAPPQIPVVRVTQPTIELEVQAHYPNVTYVKVILTNVAVPSATFEFDNKYPNSIPGRTDITPGDYKLDIQATFDTTWGSGTASCKISYN